MYTFFFFFQTTTKISLQKNPCIDAESVTPALFLQTCGKDFSFIVSDVTCKPFRNLFLYLSY